MALFTFIGVCTKLNLRNVHINYGIHAIYIYILYRNETLKLHGPGMYIKASDRMPRYTIIIVYITFIYMHSTTNSVYTCKLSLGGSDCVSIPIAVTVTLSETFQIVVFLVFHGWIMTVFILKEIL